MRSRNSKQRTTEQALVDLIRSSKTGALMQAYVVTALEKYSEPVLSAGSAHFDSSLLSGNAWVRCAQEVLDTLNRNFEAQLGRGVEDAE